jgi:hypothetical protein
VVVAFAVILQRQVLQFVDVLLKIHRHITIERPVSHQILEYPDTGTDRAECARRSAGTIANSYVLVLEHAEQWRARCRRIRCGCRCRGQRNAANLKRRRTIGHGRNDCALTHRMSTTGFHQLQLPIGGGGKLANGLAQRRVDRPGSLTSAPAVPDIPAQQVGARHHRGIACSPFTDLLLNDHGFAERGDIPQVGGLERRRRRRLVKLRRGIPEIRHHVGKTLVGRVSQREAGAALWIVLPEFHQSSPLLDRLLGREPQ